VAIAGRAAGLWHALGTKTLDLIHQHVRVEAVRDDLEIPVMDTTVTNDTVGGLAVGVAELVLRRARNKFRYSAAKQLPDALYPLARSHPLLLS
jgi:hypothetical protein